MGEKYQHIVLASRPNGWPNADNFRLEEAELRPLHDGEVRVRIRYLSLDPYMRGRMNDAKSYTAPQALNETMQGGAAGEVVESRDPHFRVGDNVVGMLGWAEYGTASAAELLKVDASNIALSAHLGVAGMPGMTAWYGYYKIMEPKAGQTVTVTAASGAVGSVVGQLARLAGVRVVGVAGGAEKCRYVTEELGFDACIDYRAATDLRDLTKMIAHAAPQGVDAHFENVGGDCLNAVLSLLNPFARVAICGLISDYNAAPGDKMQSAIRNPAVFLVSRFKMQGFIVSDHMELWPQGLGELSQHVIAGRVKYRESIAQGLASAPQAFLGMLQGANFGKQLVRVG